MAALRGGAYAIRPRLVQSFPGWDQTRRVLPGALLRRITRRRRRPLALLGEVAGEAAAEPPFALLPFAVAARDPGTAELADLDLRGDLADLPAQPRE